MRTTLIIAIGLVLIGLPVVGQVVVVHGQDITYQPGDTSGVGAGQILACPQQDGPTLKEKGLDFKVRVTLPNGHSIPRISEKDIWLSSDESVCGGRILTADEPTDESGVASFTGALRAGGGGDSQIYIMVRQNHRDLKLSKDPDAITPAIILPIRVVSPDLDGDGDVDLQDRGKFEEIFNSGTYNQSADYNMDGSVDGKDLAIFQQHFGHACHP